MQLRGVHFEYKDPKAINELEGVRTGFIAQEAEKIFPDWVTDTEAGYKVMSPKGFEALAVEALRELRDEKDKQIKLLEDQNAELLKETESLQERLDALESQVQQLVTSLQSK